MNVDFTANLVADILLKAEEVNNAKCACGTRTNTLRFAYDVNK